MRKTTYLPAIIIILLLSLIPATAPVFSKEPEKRVIAPVAKVNSTVITSDDLDIETNSLMPKILYHGHVSPEKRKAVEKKALEELINKELFFQEAKREGMSVDKDTVEKAFQSIKKRYPSEEAFNKSMKKYDLTIPALRGKIEKNILVERFIREKVMISFTDRELKEYYYSNKEKFIMPESVKLSYIWIKTDPTAPDFKAKTSARSAEALSELQSGKPFSEVAWSYSDDKSRVMGGDIGYIHRGRLPEEVENIANSLKIGQTSGIISTDTGDHIIRLEDRRPARLVPFEEIIDKLRKELTDSKRETRRSALIKRLRAAAEIKYIKSFD